MLGFALAGNHLHITGDRLHRLALLGQRGGHFMNAGTGVADCLAGQFHALGGHPGFAAAIGQRMLTVGDGALHGLAGFLQAQGQCVDLPGRQRGFFRELAHLIGHHGKAAAGFASAGGFNCGVQGQQIGLVGDFPHLAGHL